AAAITAAGGHPVLLPIAHRRVLLKRYLEGIDGLVIVGGDDIDPLLYGERPHVQTKIIHPKRTAFESWLYKAGKRRGLPILGVCYGMQLINVLEGGTLHQHLAPQGSGPAVDHQGEGGGSHPVQILPGTRLAAILGKAKIQVATAHHQGIRTLAPGFVPAALAEDGIVEAMEKPSAPQIFAVQWHPERLLHSRATQHLFNAFVRVCMRYRRTREGPGS
ncbi:MAG: gamma-glutamyl-gamma-aminobutyrate hydrolase family protein, partial [Nitrospirales bacterium]